MTRDDADNNDDTVLKVQVEGWYKQWNRMTGDDKEPNWTPPEPLFRRDFTPVTEKYPGPREPEAITLRIQHLIAEQLNLSVDDVVRASSLLELGTDSLDEIELVMAIEDEFWIEINDEDAEKMTNMEAAAFIVLRELSRQQ